jgi:transcriptional regulator with XRE-family HTH domain
MAERERDEARPGARPPGSRLGEFIRRQREVANISLRELSRLSRVSNAYLSQIERGVYEPSAKVLKGIADALHVSAERLYAEAGLLDQRQDEPPATGVDEAIRRDPNLTAAQKDTLLSVYRTFLGQG